MGDEGFDGRAIVAETYRQLAQELHVKAGVFESQARAFSDAAQRIEDGAEPSPLRMVPDDDAVPGSEMVGLVEGEEDRLLDAVIAASKLPPTEMEQATLLPLANEAGLPPDRAAELLRGWQGHLVEARRVGEDVVVLPLEAAFASRGLPVPDAEEIARSIHAHALGRRLG